MSSERIGSSGKTKGGGGPSDPDTLVREIEATREDLAVTLDAIADRVSPKRVAQRGQDRAKEFAAQAKVVLTEKAAIAGRVVSEKAATVREVVNDRTATAKEVVGEKAATAKVVMDDRTAAARGRVGGPGAAPASSVAVAGSASGGTGGELPPTTGVEVPGLVTRPGATPGPGASGWSAADVPREAVAALAAVAALLLLLRRRRRRSRSR